jgi:hypothetical protein
VNIETGLAIAATLSRWQRRAEAAEAEVERLRIELQRIEFRADGDMRKIAREALGARGGQVNNQAKCGLCGGSGYRWVLWTDGLNLKPCCDCNADGQISRDSIDQSLGAARLIWKDSARLASILTDLYHALGGTHTNPTIEQLMGAAKASIEVIEAYGGSAGRLLE